MTLDPTRLTPRHRARVERAYVEAVRRSEEDRALAAAYDEAVKVHGYPNALDEVAEEFSQRWGRRVTPALVRRARWPGAR
ncbi:MAG TPA: hypothetical protein VD838_00080 [Anaeromyxobacteraceae bacterium]|nr:hypothetical protein [Anaeromyxobacteraceae bacterium]